MYNLEKKIEKLEKELEELNEKIADLEKKCENDRDVSDANFLAVYRRIARKRNEKIMYVTTFSFFLMVFIFIYLAQVNMQSDMVTVLMYVTFMFILGCIMMVSAIIEIIYSIPEMKEIIKKLRTKKTKKKK